MVSFSVNPDTYQAHRAVMKMRNPLGSQVAREWVGEAFCRATMGAVREDTDMGAYGAVCEKNTMLATSKREVQVVSSEDMDDGARGVADVVFNYVDSNLDSIVDSEEVRYFVGQFIDMRDYLLVEEGCDLYTVFIRARDGVTRSIARLRDLIEKYNMTDMIQSLLSNSEAVACLEGMMC